MAQYQPEQLGFLDKVLKDECTSARHRRRLVKAFHAIKKGVFVCGRQFSAEELLTVDGMASNTVVEGSMMQAQFLEYLEYSVLRIPFVASYLIYCLSSCHYALLSLSISVSLS
jgi:hypothetical protein